MAIDLRSDFVEVKRVILTAFTAIGLLGTNSARVTGQHAYVGISDASPTGSDGITTRALIAAYDMSTRTPTGLLRDFGPYGHHGEISGTLHVPGIRTHAMRFRTASDRVHLPESEQFAHDGPLTLAVRVRVETLNIHQHILACDDKFALWVTPLNRFRFSDTLGHGMDTVEPVSPGRWSSVIAVYDGPYGGVVTNQTVRMYIDGVEAATQIVNRSGDDPVRWTPGGLYPADACYVGFESHQGNVAHQSLQFEGSVDELLIFGRALTINEIGIFASQDSGDRR